MDTFVALLVEQLRSRINTGSGTSRPHAVVDLARFSVYFTMDVITRLAFGQELGFLASDSDRHGLLSNLRTAVRVLWLPLVDSNVRAVTTSSVFLSMLGKKSMLGLLQGYYGPPSPSSSPHPQGPHWNVQPEEANMPHKSVSVKNPSSVDINRELQKRRTCWSVMNTPHMH